LDGRSWVTFIVDSSASRDSAFLSTVKEEIGKLADTAGELSTGTSVMSCSASPEYLVQNSWLGSQLKASLARLKGSGGFAFSECLTAASEVASDETASNDRKTIIVITKASDVSALAGVNQLRHTLPRTLARRQIVLYVVSVAKTEHVSEDFPRLVADLGGLFVHTSTADLPATLASLRDEIS
jgi:hypothetical protein